MAALPNSVHVLGAGSLGLLYSHHLRRTGVPSVTLLTRGGPWTPHTATIRLTRGFTAKPDTLTQDVMVDYVQPVPSATKRAGNRADIEMLLVATKAMDVVPAVRSVQHRLSPDSTLVLTQNGLLGVYQELWEELLHDPTTRPRVVVASTTHGSYVTGPLSVCHAGEGAVALAEVNPGLPSLRDLGHQHMWEQGPSPVLQSLLLALQGLHATLVPSHKDLVQQLLLKLAVNCCINPLTGLLECVNGHLAQDPHTMQLMRSVCREVQCLLSHELGCTEEQLFQIVVQVATATGKNRSSMLQSIASGKRTEIDYLNGYVTRLGADQQVPTPVNETLRDLIKSKEQLSKATKLATEAMA